MCSRVFYVIATQYGGKCAAGSKVLQYNSRMVGIPVITSSSKVIFIAGALKKYLANMLLCHCKRGAAARVRSHSPRNQYFFAKFFNLKTTPLKIVCKPGNTACAETRMICFKRFQTCAVRLCLLGDGYPVLFG